jgi:hypothetical protein
MNVEQGYYELAEFWDANIYQNEFENVRLTACVEAIPPSTSSLLDVGANLYGGGKASSRIARDLLKLSGS